MLSNFYSPTLLIRFHAPICRTRLLERENKRAYFAHASCFRWASPDCFIQTPNCCLSKRIFDLVAVDRLFGRRSWAFGRSAVSRRESAVALVAFAAVGNATATKGVASATPACLVPYTFKHAAHISFGSFLAHSTASLAPSSDNLVVHFVRHVWKHVPGCVWKNNEIWSSDFEKLSLSVVATTQCVRYKAAIRFAAKLRFRKWQRYVQFRLANYRKRKQPLKTARAEAEQYLMPSTSTLPSVYQAVLASASKWIEANQICFLLNVMVHFRPPTNWLVQFFNAL